jgi:hypothetical protein
MALVHVAGFGGSGFDRNRVAQSAPKMPPIFEDILDGTAEDHTITLPDGVTLVRVFAKGAVIVSIMPGAVARDGDGTDPSQSSVPMTTSQTEYFTVDPQAGCRVSVINDA